MGHESLVTGVPAYIGGGPGCPPPPPTHVRQAGCCGHDIMWLFDNLTSTAIAGAVPPAN